MLPLVSKIIFVTLLVTALAETPSSTSTTLEITSSTSSLVPSGEVEKPDFAYLATKFPPRNTSRLHQNDECPADDGQDLRLNVPLVQQQSSTTCGPAIGESLFRHLGITNHQIIISPIPFGNERNLLNLSLQDLLAFSMYHECASGVNAVRWTGTLNRIIEQTMETYGGSYHDFYYAIPQSAPWPEVREHFRGINHLIRTSLRSNMPVAMGVRFLNAPPSGVQGHFILIDGVNGGDAESGTIVYRYMDPTSGLYHEHSAVDMFYTPGREFVLIAFVPGFGSRLPHLPLQVRTVETIEDNLFEEYSWVNFYCNTERHDTRHISCGGSEHIPCANRCPSIEKPYWEDRDFLYTYKDSNNNDLCYIKLRTSTAVAIASQKPIAVFSLYLANVLKDIRWESDIPNANHNDDSNNAQSYIQKNVEYFLFKAAQIINQPQYRAIVISADCGVNTVKPEKEHYFKMIAMMTNYKNYHRMWFIQKHRIVQVCNFY